VPRPATAKDIDLTRGCVSLIAKKYGLPDTEAQCFTTATQAEAESAAKQRADRWRARAKIVETPWTCSP
jgi:hypothetical protein